LGRVVLLLIIGFAIYLLFRGFTRAQLKKRDPEEAIDKSRAQDMVACTRCGVNMPRSEARELAGQLVCNENPRCRAPE
jgi:hypothetical protein